MTSAARRDKLGPDIASSHVADRQVSADPAAARAIPQQAVRALVVEAWDEVTRRLTRLGDALDVAVHKFGGQHEVAPVEG